MSILYTDGAPQGWATVYPKKYAHGSAVLCFVVVMQSFIMNSHEVFIHIHQGCFAGIGAIVRLPQCQWSKPDGYGKISQCITTTKHSKAKTVCIFLGIYCMEWFSWGSLWVNYVPRKMPDVRSWYASYTNMRRFTYCMLHLMYECSTAFATQSVSFALTILFSHDIKRKIRPLAHISISLLFILYCYNLQIRCIPWYWSFRGHCKLM